MSKNKKVKKKRIPRSKVYLGELESAAINFLKHFSDFKGLSNSQILKTCLRIVAIDAQAKLKEAEDKYEESQKGGSTDAAGEPITSELRDGEQLGKEDQRGDSKDSEGSSGSEG